jgi:hypothetical protein
MPDFQSWKCLLNSIAKTTIYKNDRHHIQQLPVKLYAERLHSIDEICEMMGIYKPTLYKYVAEGQAE